MFVLYTDMFRTFLCTWPSLHDGKVKRLSWQTHQCQIKAGIDELTKVGATQNFQSMNSSTRRRQRSSKFVLTNVPKLWDEHGFNCLFDSQISIFHILTLMVFAIAFASIMSIRPHELTDGPRIRLIGHWWWSCNGSTFVWCRRCGWWWHFMRGIVASLSASVTWSCLRIRLRKRPKVMQPNTLLAFVFCSNPKQKRILLQTDFLAMR